MDVSCPKIDFSGLSLSSSPAAGSGVWDSVRAQVMDALLGVGFFEAVFDKLSRRLWDEAFGGPMDEAFNVPAENKMSTTIGKCRNNYFATDMYEILSVGDPTDPASVEAFTRQLCPQGIPSFSKTVVDTSKAAAELEGMIRKMIFQGLNIDKYFESHLESTTVTFRMAKYNPAVAGDGELILGAHCDPNVLSLVYQHHEDGLEVQTLQGQWYRAPRYSCVVLAAETLTVLTNGRLKSTLHRVSMPTKETRYSVSFCSVLIEGYEIEAAAEVVDEEHPRLYKPFEYGSYMKFRMTEAGYRSGDVLKEYCGIDGPEAISTVA